MKLCDFEDVKTKQTFVKIKIKIISLWQGCTEKIPWSGFCNGNWILLLTHDW